MALHRIMITGILFSCICSLLSAQHQDTFTNEECGCPDQCHCSSNLVEINCRHKGLQNFPKCLPKQVRSLNMRNNGIVTVDMSQMQTLPVLEVINLANNKISKLKSSAFSGKVTPALKTIYLNNNFISILPEAVFDGLSDLQNISFQNNYIKSIHPRVFSHCQIRQITLNLDANYMETIPAFENILTMDSFSMNNNHVSNATFPANYKNMTTINKMILSNNKITQLHNKTFINLAQSGLRILKLMENGIESIEEETFEPLKNLKSLYLGWNPLAAADLEQGLQGLRGKKLNALNIAKIQINGILPFSTFALLQNISLKVLIMNHNNIGMLHANAFSQLHGLILIDLSNSKIKPISDDAFGGLPLLSTLSLESCSLEKIPNNLPKSLVNLYLNNNQIITVPNYIFENLTSLQQLHLEENQIRGLMSESFFGLHSLRTLHLVSNKINALPGNMFQFMTNLTSLKLRKNKIKFPHRTTNPVFRTLQHLQYLDLSENRIGYFPQKLFHNLMSLLYLNLNNNEIGPVLVNDVQGQVFKDLNNLRFLYLQNNGITHFSLHAFNSLQNVLEVYMKQNQISFWKESLFKTTTNLRYLDMSLNNIAVVNSSSVLYFKKGLTLNLTGNPFACSCDMRWFRDWINKTKVKLPSISRWKCNIPSKWEGKPFLTFDKNKINCDLYTISVVITCAVGGFLGAFLLFYCLYKKRWLLRLKLYHIQKRGCCQPKHDGYEQISGRNYFNCCYDAYLSCVDEDYQWVIEHLLPSVDKGVFEEKSFGGEFCLYFEQRDATPGKSKMENMDESLDQSLKAIIILSKNYTKSRYHEMELNEIIRMKREGELQKIKVVLIEGVQPRNIPKSLQKHIERSDFLEWNNNEDASNVFMQEIKYFLTKENILPIND